MRTMTATLLAATLLAGGSSMALAQTQGDTNRTQEMNRQSNQGAGAMSADRFQMRSNLRNQMRQEGFRDIRISDAMFVVQARTPDGRTVLMVVNPSDQQTNQQMGRMQDRMDRQQMGQMGQMDQMDQMRRQMDRMGQTDRARQMDQMRDRMQQQMGQGGMGMQGDTQPEAELRQFGDARYSAERRRGEFGTDQFGTSPAPDFDDQDRRQTANRQMGDDRQQTGAVGGDRMSEDQIRSRLEERGFSNIQNWDRSGGTITATADWYGEEVDVRVNARTGEVLQPNRIATSQVGPLLEQRGFSNVRNVRRDGDVFTALADRDGSTFEVEIDPRQAQIEDRSRQGG